MGLQLVGWRARSCLRREASRSACARGLHATAGVRRLGVERSSMVRRSRWAARVCGASEPCAVGGRGGSVLESSRISEQRSPRDPRPLRIMS